MDSQKNIENTINCYDYEQYNSVWCKVISINELDLKQQNVDDNLLIQACIEEIYLNYTSESFDYNFQWKKDNWKLSTQNEHLQLLDEMIKYCFVFIEKERQEAIIERNERLSYSDENGMEEYYKHSFIDKDENPKPDFTEHQELKDNFLNNLFSKDEVRFYYNRDLKQTTKSLSERDRKNVPVVIGIDTKKIALLWFNF